MGETMIVEELSSRVESALSFAERWPAPYRQTIFEFALHHVEPGPVGVRIPPGSTPGSPYGRLAEALGVPQEAVERAVDIDEGGSIRILGRLNGASVRELQTSYALVFCLVKEKALGVRHADIEELRQLCTEQGCYDRGNFTTNFRHAVKHGLLREVPPSNGRGRQYLATNSGLEQAADALRALTVT